MSCKFPRREHVKVKVCHSDLKAFYEQYQLVRQSICHKIYRIAYLYTIPSKVIFYRGHEYGPESLE